MQAYQQLHSSSRLLKLNYCDPATLHQKYQVLAWLGKPENNLSSVRRVDCVNGKSVCWDTHSNYRGKKTHFGSRCCFMAEYY